MSSILKFPYDKCIVLRVLNFKYLEVEKQLVILVVPTKEVSSNLLF